MLNAHVITNVGHFLLLQALWPAAVLGAAAGWTWPVALTLLAMLGWSGIRRAGIRDDLRLLVAGVVVGVVFEVLLLGSGLIHYALQGRAGMPPLWILLLWGGFTLNFRHCMAWFQAHPGFAALFGLLGAPASVVAGVTLGAAQAPQGLWPLAVAYGLGWAPVMPMLAWMAARTGNGAGSRRRAHGQSVTV